ncbi:hypothetical protein [Formosa agariphila]|uniref:hypothetical protein n=1 Tax=Formosa agariphila TaxID=320324 RepID=UPI0011DDC4CA|nr:hypothetical protein [Formosa agariphila]
MEPLVHRVKEQEDNVIIANEQGREVLIDVGNMASMITSAGVDVPNLFNEQATNLSMLNNSRFKNIIAIYIAETEVSINENYPALEKHLNVLNTMLDEELD